MIGSMGLASAVGLGLAIQTPHKRIFILEGDGSALMSLGTLQLIASQGVPNLIHVILDNEVYESTGGQASISSRSTWRRPPAQPDIPGHAVSKTLKS